MRAAVAKLVKELRRKAKARRIRPADLATGYPALLAAAAKAIEDLSAGLPPMSAGEREVLAIVLKELRRAVRLKEALHVHIDPWTNGEDGTYIFAAPQCTGHTYTVLGVGARRLRPADVRRKARAK